MAVVYASKLNVALPKTLASKATSVPDYSSQSESLQRKADMANNAAQRAEAPRPNNTGLPDNLKIGIESLSGFSMDNVRVHYNSSKPVSVQALAYTQGTDIHVAPGQEKCLPHEAWHVAQQMAGRVSPTTNINGMHVNDNAALEHEADVMGEKAVQCKIERNDNLLMRKNEHCSSALVQMMREKEFKQDPETFMRENIVLCNFSLGLQKRMGWDNARTMKFLDYMHAGLFPEYFFVLYPLNETVSKPQYILTPAVEKIVKKVSMDSTDNMQIILEFKRDFEDLYTRLQPDKDSCYIEANYVPYKTGIADCERNIGSVKVRKDANENGEKGWNPNFVFTDSMNGCAFVTTMDDDKRFFSAWHFQNPNSTNIRHSSKFRQSHFVTDWFGSDEYESENHGEASFEVTPLLWRNGKGKWKIISQENHLEPLTRAVDETQSGKMQSRELCVCSALFSDMKKIKSINERLFIDELNGLKRRVDGSEGNLKIFLEHLYNPINLFVNEIKSINCDYESVLTQKKRFDKVVDSLSLIIEKEKNPKNDPLNKLNSFLVFFPRGKEILDVWVNEIKSICSENHKK